MKKAFFILTLAVISIKSIGQDTNLIKFSVPSFAIDSLEPNSILNNDKSNSNGDSIFPYLDGCDLETLAKFRGGDEQLYEFLKKNLIYPDSSISAGIKGDVIVSFEIDKLGKVRKIEIMKGLNNEINKEVIRVFSIMPDWIPGECQERKIASRLTLHIRFKLNDNE
jgi:TonB family protein